MTRILLACLLFSLCDLVIAAESSGTFPASMMTIPERTAYQRTSTFAEVLAVIDALQADTELLHREVLLETVEGRQVPLLVLADPPVRSPQAAQASGKAVIYIQGNIHGGEVEGKEALLILLRDILYGDKRHLLENQILVLVPIYNADGNDQMSADSRPSQEGSPLLAGERFAHGYDLNRDGIALEAAETSALYRNVIQRWDPDLLIDLHTTNGSWHGYPLTYAPSYRTAGDPQTSDYTASVLLPAVTQAVQEKYALSFSWYGDFDAQSWPPTEFRTFHHGPRYITNTMALRNRMAILSEAFAHDRFYMRMHATKVFVEEILEFTRVHAAEIYAMNRAADARTIEKIREQGGRFENGVQYAMVPLPEPLALLSYTHIPYQAPDGSIGITRTPELVTIEGVLNYNQFVPAKMATVPRAYVFPAQLKTVADKLGEHGVQVTILSQATEFTGEEFMVNAVGKQAFMQNGHNNSLLQGVFQPGRKTFQPGDYLVSMEQRLANLIFYLLEAEADDGLAYWNFFDAYLESGMANGASTVFPVFKVLE